jgi:hypothetical protein
MTTTTYQFPAGCYVIQSEDGCRWAAHDGDILCELFLPAEPGEDEGEELVETSLDGYMMAESDIPSVASRFLSDGSRWEE